MSRKEKIVNFFKSFNLFELIWLGSVVVLLAVFTTLFPDFILEDDTTTFIVVCSIVSIVANPICELMISKQSRYNFIVSIVFIEITEMAIYFSLGYYSSALVSLLFWVPIDIVSFFRWQKNTDEVDDNITKVKRLNWWQDVLIVAGIAAFSAVVGYLLSLIPECEDTYLDAFVSALGMANGVLLLLRYNEQWYAWFAYLVFDAVLWIVSGHYIMLITVVAMMINTVYGFVKWIIYIKKKKAEREDDEHYVEIVVDMTKTDKIEHAEVKIINENVEQEEIDDLEFDEVNDILDEEEIDETEEIDEDAEDLDEIDTFNELK